MGSRADTERQLHLPRILCLHGGGTNARIFRAQCRVLEAQLKGRFRLCYAEGPFPSEAGPDVLSVYKQWGPFKGWISWLPDQQEIDNQTVEEEVRESLFVAMDADNRRGGTGEWAGLLGFSQGAKLCASLLLSQQLRSESWRRYNAGSNFRFAVLLAGSAPIISFDPEIFVTPNFANTSNLDSLISREDGLYREEYSLKLPTIHVHGIRDPGLTHHRNLLRFCANDSTRLIEWDGDHRVPIKTKDVAVLVDQILTVARNAGVLV